MGFVGMIWVYMGFVLVELYGFEVSYKVYMGFRWVLMVYLGFIWVLYGYLTFTHMCPSKINQSATHIAPCEPTNTPYLPPKATKNPYRSTKWLCMIIWMSLAAQLTRTFLGVLANNLLINAVLPVKQLIFATWIRHKTSGIH